ncbi:MAG: M48 family metallopeptidase [Solirubrobacteraceae bacterium]
MTDNLPEAVEPYPEISSKAYEHPADRAATAALKAVPMLDTVVRKLIEFRYERALRQFYLGNSVKIGERQLPDVFASYHGVSRILDMPDEYDIYVSSALPFNAVTIGSQKPIIVFGASMLRELGPAEQRGVIAHELGHILSDHVVYMTALSILLNGVNLPGIVGLPLRAVRAVLLEWSRAAELSCDRAAVLAVRDPQIVCRTLMVVASGMPADRLDLDAFMAQAMEYENWDDSHDRVRRFFLEIGATHSFAVRRVSEVMRWVQSGEYDRIRRGEYRRRGDDADVREEAGDAMEFYAERFRALFRELGDNVTSLGSQVGDASQKAADWLRNRGAGGGRSQ